VNPVGQPERVTQKRVIALFRDELGYRYLGDWTDREGNSNIEEGLLSDWLTRSGCAPAQISVALHKLRTEASNHSRTLYGNNQAVYNLLRYGVPVKVEAGRVTETVHLVDWKHPEKNDFAIAEEVTKKPKDCLEYIVLHEMVHFIEPTHNARFVALMDRFMPKWQFCRQRLNRLPVRHADWDY